MRMMMMIMKSLNPRGLFWLNMMSVSTGYHPRYNYGDDDGNLGVYLFIHVRISNLHTKLSGCMMRTIYRYSSQHHHHRNRVDEYELDFWFQNCIDAWRTHRCVFQEGLCPLPSSSCSSSHSRSSLSTLSSWSSSSDKSSGLEGDGLESGKPRLERQNENGENDFFLYLESESQN